MMKSLTAVAIAALLMVVACSGKQEVGPTPEDVAEETGNGWNIVAVDELTEAQQAQRKRGVDAVKAMTGALMGELTTALDQDGPDGAIEVCSMRAPEIAATTSNQYGVVLGRTSFRLRNPSNLPPEWAVDLVDDEVAEPTWLVGPDGRVAGLLPIRTKAECLMCHGPREEISEDVIAKLDEYYPDDAATGFDEGDLRGWIWVEAPTG